ncbi:MAG: GDSL-type esterase/lipase family protein [Mucilaginibacter sp.]
MTKNLLFALLLFVFTATKAQQKVIQLYNGPAPGSENWTWSETENDSNIYHAHTIYNVSKPTITVYPADSTVAPTGTAIIVCPGGGFQSLSIMQEGYAVVKWLQQKGITAFLLKYRLNHTIGHDPYKQENEERGTNVNGLEKEKVVAMAIADARQALTYVRQHSAEYGVLPDRIGILGFSAGGTIAASCAYNYTPENRPDFVAPIYAYFPKPMQKTPPADAPPMFIAAATDDAFGLETHSSSLYETWVNAKHSAELHIYAKGGHGFGMNGQGLPSDTWKDRFADWLKLEGYLKPLSDKKTKAMEQADNFANFQKWFDNLLHNDWPWLSKYADANTKIKPGEKLVVFMGNSITENWGNMDAAFFKDNDYLSRGIGGQVSSQMLVRFREDVINLHPKAVVIEAGTNDIAENRGPISLENVFGNIVSMCELARASGIKPIIGSVLPASDFSWHRGLNPADKIIELNGMLKEYAAKNHIVYVDYWSALVLPDKKGMKPELTLDGLVHPNLACYKIMEPLVMKGIKETLARK